MTTTAAWRGSTSTNTTPFQIEVSPRVATAPVIIVVHARLDPMLRDAVCIDLAGDNETHSSCWIHEEIRTPQMVVKFAVRQPGAYVVQMWGPMRVSNAIDILLN